MNRLNMCCVIIHLATMLHLLYKIYWLKKILSHAIFQLTQQVVIQSVDQFVIPKIQDAWNCRWEPKKSQLFVDGE